MRLQLASAWQKDNLIEMIATTAYGAGSGAMAEEQ